MIKVLLVNNYQFLKLRGKFFHNFKFWVKIEIFFIKNARIIFVIELKRDITNVHFFDIIISKLYYQ